MATDWKTLTPEQKAEVNERRRAAYAAKDFAEKERLRLHKRSVAQIVAERKGDFRFTPDARRPERRRETPIERIRRRVDARKRNLHAKLSRYQEWRAAGGKFPWPRLQDKIHLTGLWLQIREHLTCCASCGKSKQIEWAWKLTRKDDFFAFVGFTKREYDGVLANPQQYEIYCVKCAYDLRIHAFAWVFSPHSQRNNPENPRIEYPKYAAIMRRIQAQYPANDVLKERIRNRTIRSLIFDEVHGKRIPGLFFLRRRQYHTHVTHNPRELYWPLVTEHGSRNSRPTPPLGA